MKNFSKCMCIGVVTGLCNGLFGSGGGTVVVLFMEKFLNLETKKAHATAIMIILPLTIVSLFFYTKSGYFNFKTTLWTSIGGLLGGSIGAHFLKKIKSGYIKKIFGTFMIITAVRMVLK